jgi:hypothetical protein
MSVEEQPEYCDCNGFHDDSCRDRRLDTLEKLSVDLTEAF